MAVPDAIDPVELQRILLPAFGHPGGDPAEWQVELLALPNVAGLPTVGIWRIRGEGWSVILKLLRNSHDSEAQWSSHPEPDHPYYWKREALAFQSPLLTKLPGGLRAPVCYGVVERADGSVAVWMEDVRGPEATEWTFDRYWKAARQFGLAQGGLLGPAAPTDGWLSRHYLRTYGDRRRETGNRLTPEAWRHPRVQELALQPSAVERFWADGERFLEIAESFPHTLCHLDLHPQNMFDVEGDIVVIDWAFSGIGAIGEDLGTLVIDAFADFHLAPELIPEFFDLLVNGYTEGLVEAGWDGGEAAVRRATIAGAAARYFWLPAALVTSLADERPTINRRPTADAVPYWLAASELLLERSAELG